MSFRTLAALAAGAALFATAGAALSQAPAADQPPSAEQALADARLASFKFRQGEYGVVQDAVARLEAAVQAHPNDGRLWNALGVAYFEHITADFSTGGFKDIPTHLRKAQAAHEQALALNPNDPVALAGRATAYAIAAGFTRKFDVGRQGVADLNRAVELAPDETVVRLQRAFTNLGVGPDLRDRAAAETDLRHLIRLSEGSRPGDVLHVLLGDLQFEGGRADLARAEYAAAARKDSAIRELGQARLASLASGGPPPAEVTRLRNDIARNCAMCHSY
jgi:tetratricopeptide (TPR) repeat protein